MLRKLEDKRVILFVKQLELYEIQHSLGYYIFFENLYVLTCNSNE